MQRGILSFTHSEQALLGKVVSDTSLAGSLLASKLHATSTDTDSTSEDTLELSRDEAESLLDILPIPSEQEPFEVTSIRHKLQAFLLNL